MFVYLLWKMLTAVDCRDNKDKFFPLRRGDKFVGGKSFDDEIQRHPLIMNAVPTSQDQVAPDAAGLLSKWVVSDVDDV